jgi:hypothetical protein
VATGSAVSVASNSGGGSATAVAVGRAAGAAVGVDLGLGADVAVAVGRGSGVLVGVAVGVAVGRPVGASVGVAVGVGVGLGFGLINVSIVLITSRGLILIGGLVGTVAAPAASTGGCRSCAAAGIDAKASAAAPAIHLFLFAIPTMDHGLTRFCPSTNLVRPGPSG